MAPLLKTGSWTAAALMTGDSDASKHMFVAKLGLVYALFVFSQF